MILGAPESLGGARQVLVRPESGKMPCLGMRSWEKETGRGRQCTSCREKAGHGGRGAPESVLGLRSPRAPTCVL